MEREGYINETREVKDKSMDAVAKDNKVELKNLTLRTAALEAVLEAKGDRAEAITLLEKRVKGSAVLRRDIIVNSIKKAVQMAVAEHRHDVWRRPYLGVATIPNADDTEGLASLADSNIKDFLNVWALRSASKMLGEATRNELMDEWDYYDRGAKDLSTRRRFVRLILDEMGDHQFVKDALTNRKLAELILQAKEQIEDE